MRFIQFKITLLPLLIFAMITVSAQQDWRFQIGDKWFNEHQGLKVGDKMPDVSFMTFIGNTTKKYKISDFKGKLVILDFWTYTCKSCIAAFPKMEKLQEQFGDKIKILIAYPQVTKEIIDTLFKVWPGLKGKKLPNLPCIVSPSKEISEYFPTRFVPHHVWIDGEGIIRLIGPDYNTYAEKIKSVLEGKQVSYLNSANNTPLFNKNIPYYSIIGKTINPNDMNSFFTQFNNEYAVHGSLKTENQLDTKNNTIRDTYINMKLYDLYFNAFKNELAKDYNRTILSININANCQLFIKDSSFFYEGVSVNDMDYMQKRFCYELIAPVSESEVNRNKRMQNDLNKDFSRLFGFHARLEAQNISCYILKLAPGIKLQFTKATHSQTDSLVGGIQMVRFSSKSLQNIIKETIGKTFIDNLNGQPFILLDETGYNGFVNLEFPIKTEIRSIADFKKALQKNGLNIIEEVRSINSLVIRQN